MQVKLDYSFWLSSGLRLSKSGDILHYSRLEPSRMLNGLSISSFMRSDFPLCVRAKVTYFVKGSIPFNQSHPLVLFHILLKTSFVLVACKYISRFELEIFCRIICCALRRYNTKCQLGSCIFAALFLIFRF